MLLASLGLPILCQLLPYFRMARNVKREKRYGRFRVKVCRTGEHELYPHMLKSDPNRKLIFIGGLIEVVGSAAGLIYLLISWRVSRTHYISVVSLGSYALILASGLFLIFGPSRLNHYERRRSTAASGSSAAVLAVPRPLPDSTALPMPTVIALHPKGRVLTIAYLLVALLWLLLSVVAYVVAVFVSSRTQGVAVFAVIVALISFPVALAFVLVLLLAQGIARQRIIVTSDSLSVHRLWRTTSIPWGEARLFAVYARTLKDELPVQYELSGLHALVRWTRLWPAHRSAFALPALPFEEYERQMDALLSVIAARTGLPLYDLR